MGANIPFRKWNGSIWEKLFPTMNDFEGLAGAGRTTETVKGVNDALLTHKDDNASHVPHIGTTTNDGNTYSVTSTETINDGDKFSVKFNAAATDTATLNISSDGMARTLKKPDGSNFKPKAGAYSFIRDGVNFQLLGEGGEYGTATQAEVLTGYSIGTENGVVDGSLSLTGTATADKVGNGYTFYKDDAKTKLTGSGALFTPYTAGDVVLFSSEANHSIQSTTYTMAKSIRLKGKGTVRVSYKLYSNGGFANAKLYQNGVPISVERETGSTQVTYTQDVSFVENDTIEVWIKNKADYPSAWAIVGEFRIKALNTDYLYTIVLA